MATRPSTGTSPRSSRGIGGHHGPHEGRTDEWITPPGIITALGPFDLDPCSPARRPWPTAARHFTEVDDGLVQPWAGRVWLNPPYGTATGTWLAKLADHGTGTALIFARTETEMFFTQVWERATALRFLRRRVRFCDVHGVPGVFTSGGPSVLVAYGDDDAARLARCEALPGHLVRLRGGPLGT